MKKIISLTGLLLIAFLSGMAQPAAGTSKEQQVLERQRQQLKKELEQVQEMLSVLESCSQASSGAKRSSDVQPVNLHKVA